MAQTLETLVGTAPKPATHILEVTFTVDFTADDRTQTPDAMRHEARTWLAMLGAEVQRIQIRAA